MRVSHRRRSVRVHSNLEELIKFQDPQRYDVSLPLQDGGAIPPPNENRTDFLGHFPEVLFARALRYASQTLTHLNARDRILLVDQFCSFPKITKRASE